MDNITRRDCARQRAFRAGTIKSGMRTWLDLNRLNVEGVAMEMEEDSATLRRYLSDTYPSTLPVDKIHGWFVASGGDLSPVRQQLRLCGFDIVPLDGSSVVELAGDHDMLDQHAEQAANLTAGIASALRGPVSPGVVDANEAKDLLPAALKAVAATQAVADELRRKANGVQA